MFKQLLFVALCVFSASAQVMFNFDNIVGGTIAGQNADSPINNFVYLGSSTAGATIVNPVEGTTSATLQGDIGQDSIDLARVDVSEITGTDYFYCFRCQQSSATVSVQLEFHSNPTCTNIIGAAVTPVNDCNVPATIFTETAPIPPGTTCIRIARTGPADGVQIYVDPMSVDISLAAVHGDPHIKGFDGSEYMLKGEVGKTFNLITDPSVQVNTLLSSDPTGSVEGTFMGALSFQTMKNDYIVYSNGTIFKNGKQLKADNIDVLNKQLLAQDDEASLRVLDERFVNFVNKQFLITVEFIQDETLGGFEYLNIFGATLLKKSLDIHGILGQSAHQLIKENLAQLNVGKGLHLIGQESDYLVKDGLLGTEFKYNRFQKQVAKRSVF